MVENATIYKQVVTWIVNSMSLTHTQKIKNKNFHTYTKCVCAKNQRCLPLFPHFCFTRRTDIKTERAMKFRPNKVNIKMIPKRPKWIPFFGITIWSFRSPWHITKSWKKKNINSISILKKGFLLEFVTTNPEIYSKWISFIWKLCS